MSGVILAVFIAIGVAWFFTRGRRRLGLGVNGKHWGGIIVVVAVLLVLAYGASHVKH